MTIYTARHVTNEGYNQADTLDIEALQTGESPTQGAGTTIQVSIDCDEESQYLMMELSEDEAVAMANAILDHIVPKRMAKHWRLGR